MNVQIGSIEAGQKSPLFLIAGPCVVESRDLIRRTAEVVRSTAAKYRIPGIFKSSYRKAKSGSETTGL